MGGKPSARAAHAGAPELPQSPGSPGTRGGRGCSHSKGFPPRETSAPWAGRGGIWCSGTSAGSLLDVKPPWQATACLGAPEPPCHRSEGSVNPFRTISTCHFWLLNHNPVSARGSASLGKAYAHHRGRVGFPCWKPTSAPTRAQEESQLLHRCHLPAELPQ